ncbi:unnamed protein product [Candidula unifasciata]|uniref:RNA polymerase II-associated protein 1 n=1 Tax=Candidula unifasciata TaxID=100452 RepID=A0A8S3YPY8_9EUPU|nr:unnamed protein product [Candidula unifasciata]
MSTLTRPKPGEDEDDLLKLQEQFLASAPGGRPTVTIKRPDKRKTDGSEKEEGRHIVKMEAIPAKKSKFKLDTELEKRKQMEAKPPLLKADDVDDIEELLDRHDRGMAAVLTTIIERDTRNEMYMAPVLGKQGFPKAIHNNRSKTETTKIRKKSLFAQQVEAHSSLQFGVEPAPQRSVSAFRGEAQAGVVGNPQQGTTPGSYIVEGIGLGIHNSQAESLKIHDENVQKLAGMSETDILEERQKLLEMLDPKLIEFLKKKRKAKEESSKTAAVADAKKVSFSVQREVKQRSEAAQEDELPVRPNKNWINMGTVEGEKLEWMKDLPPPSSVSSQTGRPARFDFQGNIMAVDADVPVNLGLHHHGEEPERAGYTLEEMFLLARSSNLQQRVIALHTLARVINQAKSGYLSEKIETPIIPAILAGGVVMLLRWALDDTAEGTVAAAVDALHALLCSPLDEEAADITWAWFLGNLSAALTPSATLEKEAQSEDTDEENKEEETDADVVRRDIIEALVKRMELLVRFRYIFQSMRPQAATVVQMLEILTRAAQHSGNMAYEILKCPGLVDTVMTDFLPTAWTPPDCSKPVSCVYGLPVPAAMHFMQVLCQAGRNMASIMVSKHQLNVRLLRYLALPSRDLHLPFAEAVDLQRESLGTWRVCVSYGLAMQTYFDLYSSILLSLGKLEDRWLLSCDSSTMEKAAHDPFTLDVRMICVLEKVLCVAGYSSTLQEGSDYGRSEETTFTSANWSHVTEILYPIKAYTIHVLNDLSTSYPVKKQKLDLPTACLNFLATYYELEGRQSGIDVIASLDSIEQFCRTCIIPLLSSHGLSVIIDSLSSHSNLLAPASAVPTETASNLPSLCVCKVPNSEDTALTDPATCQETWKLNMPVLLPHSPFGLLVALLRLMLAVCRRHKSLIPQLIEPVVHNKDILVYMAKTCAVSRSAFHTAHFTGGENLLHYYWLKCCTLVSCQNMSLAHRVALQLVARVHHGNEHLVHDLISTVVFSPNFLSEGEDTQLTSEALEGLNITENLHIISATQEEISLSKHKLLQQTYLSLAKIRGHYLQAFGGMEEALQDSRNLFMGNPQEIQSQMITGAGESLMPRDWMFLPLIHVYNKAAQARSVSGDSVSPQGVAMVTSVLQWTYALETWRPVEMDQISVTLRLTRVMCAFIAGNDLFLERPVNHYLAGLLRVFATQKHLDKLDFEERVPGITSSYDLYQEFLEHYEGVSFGDPVFGLYVLLPLQQRHSSLLRKAVWGERRRMLRTLRISLTEMLIPLENYLQPEEQDVELLQLYLSAIITKGVQSVWSPVLYLIAVHHVNRFIYILHEDGNGAIRSHMWKQILANESKVSDVIYYKQANVSMPQGMELYDPLPQGRLATLIKRRNAIQV